MGFSRQEYWSGLTLPSPGDLPDLGIEPGSPALEADALTSEPKKEIMQLLVWLKRPHSFKKKKKKSRKGRRKINYFDSLINKHPL